MATSGTNNTVSWAYSNGTLTIKPTNGTSGVALRDANPYYDTYSLLSYIPLDESYRPSVKRLTISGNVRFKWECEDPLSGKTTTGYNFPKIVTSDYGVSSYLFNSLESVDFSGWNAAECGSFNYWLNQPTITSANLACQNLTAIYAATWMVGAGLTEFDNTANGWNASIHNADYMFYNASGMKKIDLRGLNLSTLSSFTNGFSQCKSLESLNLVSTGFNDASCYIELPNFPVFDEDGVMINSQAAFNERKDNNDAEHLWTVAASGIFLSASSLSISRNEYAVSLKATVSNSSDATLYAYVKESSATSYPTTAALTKSLTAGTTEVDETLTVTTDKAMDMKLVVKMGDYQTINFLDIDSNTCVFEIDKDNGSTTFHAPVTMDSTLTVDGAISAPYLVGSIQMYGGATAPTGWLLCDGSAVSRTTYARLFEVLGTAYGEGDGSTTFNVPNLQDRFALGSSSGKALGATGGEETHTLTTAEMPSHSHAAADGWHFYRINASGVNVGKTTIPIGNRTNYTNIQWSDSAVGWQHDTASAGSSGSHNNMPPFLSVNYIVYAG